MRKMTSICRSQRLSARRRMSTIEIVRSLPRMSLIARLRRMMTRRTCRSMRVIRTKTTTSQSSRPLKLTEFQSTLTSSLVIPM